MDDLISRQAAIDALEESKARYFDRRVIIGKMQDIINALPSAQPERKTGQWIPVTERLPEENGRYLTVHTLNTIPPQPWMEVYWFATDLHKVDRYEFQKKKSGFYGSDSEYGFYEVSGITHWMPLPEPPKEE